MGYLKVHPPLVVFPALQIIITWYFAILFQLAVSDHAFPGLNILMAPKLSGYDPASGTALWFVDQQPQVGTTATPPSLERPPGGVDPS